MEANGRGKRGRRRERTPPPAFRSGAGQEPVLLAIIAEGDGSTLTALWSAQAWAFDRAPVLTSLAQHGMCERRRGRHVDRRRQGFEIGNAFPALRKLGTISPSFPEAAHDESRDGEYRH